MADRVHLFKRQIDTEYGVSACGAKTPLELLTLDPTKVTCWSGCRKAAQRRQRGEFSPEEAPKPLPARPGRKPRSSEGLARTRPAKPASVPEGLTLEQALTHLSRWEQFWGAHPDDRLYDSRTQTWWKRRHGQIPAWEPLPAGPPKEVMVLVRACRAIPKDEQSQELREVLKRFPP